MKYILFLSLIFLSTNQLHAQMEFTGADIKIVCERSFEFEKDQKFGIIKVYKSGAQSLSKTFERLLLRKYNITLIETDLFVIADSMICYNNFSLPMIYKKYGKDVFKNTQTEANRLDRTGKGDAPAKFKPNQQDAIRNYIYQRVDPKWYDEYLKSEKEELPLYCYLQIDASGKIYRNYGAGLKQTPIDSVINKMLQQCPDALTPALEDGKPTKGKISLHLRFNDATKQQYLQGQVSEK